MARGYVTNEGRGQHRCPDCGQMHDTGKPVIKGICARCGWNQYDGQPPRHALSCPTRKKEPLK